ACRPTERKVRLAALARAPSENWSLFLPLTWSARRDTRPRRPEDATGAGTRLPNLDRLPPSERLVWRFPERSAALLGTAPVHNGLLTGRVARRAPEPGLSPD